MSDSTWTCDGEAVRETEKAVLVQLETGDEKWIPKSVIHDDSEVWKAGQAGRLVVLGWWAEKEKLA